MHIPSEIIELIIGQLTTVTDGCRELRNRWLRTTSLVSTAWRHPSQRHLFFTITFRMTACVEAWCSRVRPFDPDGVSRHVRVLRFEARSLHLGTLEAALPHFTSFRYLTELNIDWVHHGCSPHFDISDIALDILVPIFTSSADTLERLRWTQEATTDERWETLYIVANLLPNLADIDLSGFHGHIIIPPTALHRMHLFSGCGYPDPSAFKHFRFRELVISVVLAMRPTIPSPSFLEYCNTHLRVLDLTNWKFSFTCMHTEASECFRAFFIKCYGLEEIGFSFEAHMGGILNSVSSNSIGLVRLHEPEGVDDYLSIEQDEWLCTVHEHTIQEYTMLGTSIQKMARKFSDSHPGLKTRVQVNHQPSTRVAQRIRDGEIPSFMKELDGRLGTHVTLELNLLLS